MMEDSRGRKTACGIIISKGGCSITYREQKCHDRSIRYCSRLGCCASLHSKKHVAEQEKKSLRSSSFKSLSSIGFKEPRLEQRSNENVAESSRSLDAKCLDSNRRLGKKEKSPCLVLKPLVESAKIRRCSENATVGVGSCSMKLSSRSIKEVSRHPRYRLGENSSKSRGIPMSPSQTLPDMSSRSEEHGMNNLGQADASDLLMSNLDSAASAIGRIENVSRRFIRSGGSRGKSITSSSKGANSGSSSTGSSSLSVTLQENLTSHQNSRGSRNKSTSMSVASVRTRHAPSPSIRTRPLGLVDQSGPMLTDPVSELRTGQRSSRSLRDGYPRLNTESIAEVLLELESEQDEGLTYEQLSFLGNHLFLDSLIHDQYRDMRMDIDNMTYEELLALGEKIGTVSTALTEEALSKCLKRSKYVPISSIPGLSSLSEGNVKCTICQEEWMVDDELGTLRCEHFYHVQCIDQWLRLKNWCPICKASVSPTS
ncbi:probable E3 ubiquitin-protein ligase RHG1A [Zingiber officinale]|uniref:probable E3 ubiquitin-protein ligase RHG1A n=1 Tax=Zingiber officinale TaxID=94328 RepID=UPI001C4BADFA|nr:probable E3 ubiquitin-protein ligase RHG1A [Zingiber officinale]XP_042450904.1 probable E3 ubiquitin-protein ligase RHG1A [Zingiber officinale]